MSDRQTVADAIAVDLAEVESAIETAFAKTAYFLASLPERRVAANLSPASGQKLFSTLMEASSHLTSARGSIIETHNAAEALRRVLRLHAPMTSDDSPPADKPDQFATALRTVADRAAA